MTDTTSLRDDSQKDAATLEREIDQTRAQMDRTLGALERKFSPGEFLDQAMDLVRQNGGKFASSVGNVITRNPGPALVTAAGLVWMLISSNRSETGSRARPLDDEYDPPVENYYRSGTGTEDKSGVLAQAGQRISSAAEATRQTLTSSKQAVSSAYNKTTETARLQATHAREGFNNIREGFNNITDEQPLILGALGMALGAAIGAALPTTEQEDRLLGSASDSAVAQVKKTGSESYDQVKESVTQLGAEAKKAVSDTLGKAGK